MATLFEKLNSLLTHFLKQTNVLCRHKLDIPDVFNGNDQDVGLC